MIDPTNRVLTNLQFYIDSKTISFDTVNYTIIESPLPTVFPTVNMEMIGNDGNYDLVNFEGSADLTYNIKVYSDELENPTETRKLFAYCDDAMRKMGFARRGTMRMTRLNETTFYIVARYTRIIGDVNSDIPKFT